MSTIALKHVLPVSLVAALLYAPPTVLERFLDANPLKSKWADAFRPVLKALLVLGIVRSLNTALNAWAQNGWRATAHGGWDWPNEIAVVTGGSQGIGRAIAEGLALRGVKVAILDVQEAPGDLRSNTNIAFFKCDVTSLAAVAEAGEAVVRTLGHPTILVNNAGVANRASILEKSEESLRRVLGVNLMALWWTTKTFLPEMVRRNKGHVATVASLASFVSLPTSVEYSATKAGALSFHEGLTSEIRLLYKAPGIMTSVVHPNFVKTGMTDPFAAHIEAKTGKMLAVEDISRPVLAQIFARRGGQLIVPGHLSFLSGIRGWPSWLQEVFRDRG